MGNFIDKVKGFLHLTVPATVDGNVIRIPAFEVPVDEVPTPLEGIIAVEVEPETKAAVVKVALKKKTPKKPVKKKPAKR